MNYRGDDMRLNSVFRKLVLTTILLCIPLILQGCTRGEYGGSYKQHSQSTYDYGSHTAGDDKPVEGPRAYGKLIKGSNNHDNTQYRYSKETSYLIGDLPGVSQAYVFLTDRNAYVGLLLDNTGAGLHSGLDVKDNIEGYINHPKANNVNPKDPRRLAIGYENPQTVQDHHLLSHEFKQTVAVNIRKKHPELLEIYISANQDYVNTLSELSRETNGKADENSANLRQFNALVLKEFS